MLLFRGGIYLILSGLEIKKLLAKNNNKPFDEKYLTLTAIISGSIMSF